MDADEWMLLERLREKELDRRKAEKELVVSKEASEPLVESSKASVEEESKGEPNKEKIENNADLQSLPEVEVSVEAWDSTVAKMLIDVEGFSHRQYSCMDNLYFVNDLKEELARA